MPFLKDYLFYNSGNECPENFHIFAALAVASSVVNRKVYIDWPPNRIYPNLYILLVGDQGSRKGVAKSLMQRILIEHFPAIPRGASTTTPQAITKRLASIDCTVAFTDEKGVGTDVHCMTFCIGELKHFLGINMTGMLDLLTDAYDEVYIEADYKNTGNDPIERPYLVWLACETPDWVLDRLKTTFISGGFARRIIPVYEKEIRCPIPEPYVTPEMQAAMDRCLVQLKKVHQKVGQMQFDPDARKFYHEWYFRHFKNKPSDPLLKGFHSSHHTQVLKIATLLALLERDELILMTEDIQVAIGLVNRVLPGMEELFRGAGRNILAQPMQRLLDWLKQKGGSVMDKELRIFAARDMDPRELESIIAHLTRTEQIVVTTKKSENGVDRKWVYSRAAFEAEVRKQAAVKEPASPSPLPPPPTSEGSPPEVGQSSAPP